MPLPMPLNPMTPQEFATELLGIVHKLYGTERPINIGAVKSALASAVAARDFALVTSASNALGGTHNG